MIIESNFGFQVTILSQKNEDNMVLSQKPAKEKKEKPKTSGLQIVMQESTFLQMYFRHVFRKSANLCDKIKLSINVIFSRFFLCVCVLLDNHLKFQTTNVGEI